MRRAIYEWLALNSLGDSAKQTTTESTALETTRKTTIEQISPYTKAVQKANLASAAGVSTTP